MVYQDVRKMLCKLISNIQLITEKRPTLQSSKKQIMYMSYSRKQVIKAVKFRLRNFGGLALILLNRCYLTTITWYAKLAPTRRKCFTVCECVNSHPANARLIYELRHKNRKLIRNWASNTMICMPNRGDVTTRYPFLTPRKIMQRHPIHPKLQYSLIYQWGNAEHIRNHTRVCPRKYSSNRTSMWRNRFVSLTETWTKK